MSWQDIMRRVLPPIAGVPPHTTSAYGATDRPPGSSNPHGGVDFNYKVPGQRGINLAHPALRSPVAGVVTNAGEGADGRIAIRDANGFTHEIIHSHTRHVTVGDPVVAGQLIGTMGNTGVNKKEPKKGPQHVHYQLKDSAGNLLDPSAYWDQQGRVDPNPAPPAFLNEHQRYLRRVDETSGNVAATPMGADTSMPFGTGGQFAPGSATSSRPLYETRSFGPPSEEAVPADSSKNVRRLVRMPARKQDLAGFDPTAPATVPNQINPADGPASFGDRFGNWVSSSGVSAPLAPNQQMAPPPQAGRPLGLVTGQPMPDYLFPLPIPSNTGNEDWAWSLLRRPEWDKKR